MYGLGAITVEQQRAKIQQKISSTEALKARVIGRIPVAKAQRKPILRRKATAAEAKLTRLRTRLAALTPSASAPAPVPIPSGNGYWSDSGAAAPPASVPGPPMAAGTPEGAEIIQSGTTAIVDWFTNNPLAVTVIGGVLLFTLTRGRS